MADEKDKKRSDLTPVEKRFGEGVVNISLNDPKYDDIGFMPAGLCHVFFPYKDPGQESLWIRKHGDYTLTMEATTEINPETDLPEKFGLPFGAKPRMMLALLNTIAIKTKSPELFLGNSLTEFIGQYLQMDTNGRAIREVKNHMARLASADIKIHHKTGESTKGYTHSTRRRVNIINDLDIWWSKSPNQRHFWGNNLRFSDEYFKALQEHGVPLDLRALRAISNKPIAIDLYSFLAHRLHVLSQPLFITWKAMKDQFGYMYKNMDDFKKEFRHCLNMVKAVYPDARVEEDNNKGFYLMPSYPPIRKTKTLSQATEYVVVNPTPRQITAPKKKKKSADKTTSSTADGTPAAPGQTDTAKPIQAVLTELYAAIQVEEKSKK